MYLCPARLPPVGLPFRPHLAPLFQNFPLLFNQVLKLSAWSSINYELPTTSHQSPHHRLSHGFTTRPRVTKFEAVICGRVLSHGCRCSLNTKLYTSIYLFLNGNSKNRRCYQIGVLQYFSMFIPLPTRTFVDRLKLRIR